MSIVKRFKGTAISSLDLVNDVREKGLKEATKDTLKENVKDISVGKATLGLMTGGISLAFTGVKKKGTTKIEREESAARKEYLNGLTLDQCIVTPQIKMDDNETCYYKGYATCLYSHIGVTGYSGPSASIKITKHIRVGGSEKKANRGNIVDEYPGTLYITNKRFILTAQKHGFRINIKDVESMELASNHFKIYKNSVCHEFLSDDVDLILRVIELMAENEKKQCEATPSEEVDPYEEMKKLKELFDMGIITEDEFEAKKKKLLDI